MPGRRPIPTIVPALASSCDSSRRTSAKPALERCRKSSTPRRLLRREAAWLRLGAWPSFCATSKHHEPQASGGQEQENATISRPASALSAVVASRPAAPAAADRGLALL